MLAGFAHPTQRAMLTRPHVVALAAPELEGRLTGSEGARAAAAHIAGALRGIGAMPLPGSDDHLQPFEFTAGVRDTGSVLEVMASGVRRRWSGVDAVQALSFSDSGEVSARVVFAGYGLVIPKNQDYPYDSYAGIDVKGKVVIALRYVPADVDADTRSILNRYSGLRYKALVARERGAAALIVVSGPRSPNAGDVISMVFDTAVVGSEIVAASISGEVARSLFALAGRSLEESQANLDAGDPHITGFELAGVALTVTTALERQPRVGNNVVGYLPATTDTPAAKPYLVLGAHYDHLGRGGRGNSLARRAEAGEIHPGADDNASGVAAVLAAGARLAAGPRARNVVLAFWSGEELGLLGSTYFLSTGALPADQIAAYINFDMVGRMRENRLVLQAVGSSEIWPGLIEQANVLAGFDVQLQQDPYLPTDSSSFHQSKIPTLNFFTGSHEDYHRPSDIADLINYEDLDRIAQLGATIAVRLCALDAPPDFVAVARSTAPGGDRDSLRVFTGTIPDYGTDVEGLLLGGVIEGGPAEESGLRGGDVIVKIGGQTVANIYDYTYALETLKIDEPVKVVFIRDDESHEVMLTPRTRR